LEPGGGRTTQIHPAPDASGNPVTGASSYVTSAFNRIRKDTFSVRLDRQLTPAQRLSGRYNFDNTPLNRPSPRRPSARRSSSRNFGLDYTVTLSPVMGRQFPLKKIHPRVTFLNLSSL
jgi:hypothetical protein